MAGEIDIDTVAKAYARWAPGYDFVFGAVFDAGRKASIAAAERIGGGAPAGLGAGIPVGEVGAVGGASRRGARARPPGDAAARTFLADPVRAEAGGQGRPGTAGGGRKPARAEQGGLRLDLPAPGAQSRIIEVRQACTRHAARSRVKFPLGKLAWVP